MKLPACQSLTLGLLFLGADSQTPGVAAEPPAGARSIPQALASFQLADPALVIELVASEPDVASPVAMAWDADGRLYVAEMFDYPLGPAPGRIKVLEDRDGDGVYETSHVFADQLPFPNGVLPWNGGLFVTAAPDLLYLKDTDGDGKADIRKVLFTGFGEGNQQLRANGLRWGPDGWIYGANGRSDGEVRRPDDATSISLRGHDFRFRPDTEVIESLAGRSQFGLGLDDWGNRFLSWNTIPIRHDAIPERYLLRNPRLPASQGVQNLLPAGDSGRVYPRSPVPRTFNQESTSHFNALGGLTIFRGDALPASYYGNAFMGETLRNLIHRRALDPEGATFTARRTEKETEFLTSTDPWFHPVNFATGPDGALYVADFYRLWVEHPGFVHDAMKEQVDWREGSGNGRIWRIRSRDFKRPPKSPAFGSLAPAELAARLESPNGWVRDTAQRLLVEKKDPQSAAAVRPLVTRSARPATRALALWTLELLGGLEESDLNAGLNDPNPRVRETALRVAEPKLGDSPGLQQRLPKLAKDADPRVRLQALLEAGGGMDPAARAEMLADVALQPDLDPLTILALRSSLGDRPWPVLEQVLWTDRLSADPSPSRLEFLRGLAAETGAAGPDQDRNSLLAMLANLGSRGIVTRHLALFDGLAAGWASADPGWREHLGPWLDQREERKRWHQELARAATTLAGATNQPDATRRIALSVLARVGSTESGLALRGFLKPPHSEATQAAAAAAIADAKDAPLFREALTGWKSYPVRIRRGLLAGAARTAENAAALVDLLERGVILPAELDPVTQQGLRGHKLAELAERVEKALGPRVSADRQKVVESFAPALALAGDPRRGGGVFSRGCLTCHRIGDRGQSVGPDLSGVGTRPKESLLADILDPSRQVPGDFVSYSVVTSGGDTLTGLLVSETPGGVTLRRPGTQDEFVPRERVVELQASGKSLMPDGLEAGLTPQDIADLLAFLQKPAATLLPPGT
ncbi:MAG TPA: hypothetical protein DCM86_01175 [Verrucomicrobiales bacterium]|nr:hypothetical protein [Verrucomicrobiales bacterium]